MELTQEYFDRQVEKLASKEDLQSQTEELKDYIHDSFEKQQEYIDERVTELMDQNKVKEDVTILKQELAHIKATLHLS